MDPPPATIKPISQSFKKNKMKCIETGTYEDYGNLFVLLCGFIPFSYSAD